MDEIESILRRSPGLTPLGLRMAIGAGTFNDRDVVTMMRAGRLRSEAGARPDIIRYYVASEPAASALRRP